jgi:CHAT domain-containing protein
VLVSQDATKKNFFKLAKDYQIIHLATHGVLQTNPLESYLLFSGKNNEDKQLTLIEIAGYTALRDKNSLVFLSACETASESKHKAGSELISLAEAFAMAGSPTLIASLWAVDDASTRKLAIAFYETLKEGKKDKLDSLREAQIMLLKTKEYSHPFYWAPFLMIGSWK